MLRSVAPVAADVALKILSDARLHFAHRYPAQRRRLHLTFSALKKKNILNDPLPVVATKTVDVRVLLLDETGKDIGIYPRRIAQDKADASGLRMVNVKEYPNLEKAIGRTSVHPIYKLIRGEDLHMLQMNDRDTKKHLKKTEAKTLQLTSTASDHDVETKIKSAKGWLEKGDNVKVLIIGRTDRQARMNELHQLVLAKLRPLAQSTIPDLSKSETKINFTLLALDVEKQVPAAQVSTEVHTKTEMKEPPVPLHEASKEYPDETYLKNDHPSHRRREP